MPPARTFRDLVVWQKSHQFVLGVYADSARFPKHELFGMVGQLRKSAVSIPANIAEGFRRRGRSDKARFMNIAQGSVEEARYYLILAGDLGYLKPERLMGRLEEISKMLDSYSRTILASVS